MRPVVSLSSISSAGCSSLRFPTDVTDPAIVTSSPGTHDSMSSTRSPGCRRRWSAADSRSKRSWLDSVNRRQARPTNPTVLSLVDPSSETGGVAADDSAVIESSATIAFP